MSTTDEKPTGPGSSDFRFTPPMGLEEIKQILPHRPPFLFVDRIEAMVPDRSIEGYKHFTAAEPMFRRGLAFVPPAIMAEVMAQVGAILVLNRKEYTGKLIYFMRIERARFRKPVPPGSLVHVVAEVVRLRQRVGTFKGTATVDGELVADAVMMFSM